MAFPRTAARAAIGLLGAWILVLACPAESSAQDLLQLFMPGDASSRMMGGNAFGPPFPGSDQTVGTGMSRHPAVIMQYQYDDVYRESRGDGAYSGLQRRLGTAEIFVPLDAGPSRSALQLDVRSRGVQGGLLYSTRDRAQLQGSHQSVMMTYSMNLSRTLRWNLGLGRSLVSGNVPQEYEGGLLFRSSSLVLNVTTGTRSHFQSVELNIAGVRGILPLDFRQTGLEAAVSFAGESVQIEGRGYQGFISPLPGLTHESDTRLVPSGRTEGYSIRAVAPLSPDWHWLVIAERRLINGGGTYYSRGSSYANLKGGGYANTMIAAALQYARPTVTVVADAGFRSLSASVEGFAESWPFISVLESPVSQREYFRMRGSLSLWQLHVGAELAVTHSLGLGLGANAVRLAPALNVDSWESRFLSFGTRDQQGSATIRYSITQFIPVRLERVEPTGGQISLSSSTSTLIRSSGGQFHTLTVAYQL